MKQKFQTVEPWISHILHTIKKEIKGDHLSKSPSFHRAHFSSRPINRLTSEEIIPVYQKELLKGEDESLAEWVINRWVFRHGDIYDHFASFLAEINPEFEEITSLTEEQSRKILDGAVSRFGALPVYLFSVLNGVVFPEKVLLSLRKTAEKEENERREETEKVSLAETVSQMEERHRVELAKMEKKYEDKLSGLVSKHDEMIEALKKQIRSLQKQLQNR